VVESVVAYASRRLAEGEPLQRLTQPLLGLFAGQRGTRAWKRQLSENAHRRGAGVEVLREALRRVPAEVLDARPEACAVAA
jgi:tRNA-dihydrouridine synthase A